MSKFSEKLQEFDEKQFTMILWGIVVFVFVLNYFVVLGPQIKKFMELTPAIKKRSEEIAKTNNDLQRVQQYRKNTQELQDQIKEANANVTNKTDVPLILEKISRIANRNGITIDQLNPFFQDEEIILESDDRNYFSLPIVIQGTGEYHNFGKFINEVELDNVYLRVSKFSIRASDNIRQHDLNVNIRAIIYEKVYK